MDVAVWLRKLGLEQYAAAFRDNEIDARVLPSLTAEDLKDLGVTLVGHRRRLLDAIAALGSPLPDSPPPAREGRVGADAERRQLTVMFCDLVGSTELSSRLDPEDLREVIAVYHRAVADVIKSFDGFVSRYMGDGVLVYFGYPQAHEDDAERAVRAGLGAIDAVGRLDVESVKLQARVGIATGLVVVGDLIGEGSVQEQTVVGETPNLAARLQSLAEPDAVVIAANTRRLVGDLFEYRDLGAVEVKGIAAPVPAWQVLRPSVVESRFEALHGSALTPLVGRDEEIDLLLRRWARAKAGDGQVVLVSGEPGLGKSRIAAALTERLQAEPYLRLRYFCSPYHQDSALFPFIDQLGRASGFAGDDPPTAKLEKLEALLAHAASPDEDVALLADLLSLPASERHPLPNLSPQRKKERTLEALIRQLEGLARRQPVTMVFEDAHWSDPTSRELLDLTVERVRSLPVLLLVTFRPEFQMPWTGQAQVSMLVLNRLDRQDRTVLIEQIAGGKALPDEVVDQIADRADGVPLFIEELTKSVLESGLLREEADRYVLDRALSPFAIPTSLHDSLMARLDRLASIRLVAQIGAAIGREFSYALLRAVSRLPEDELRAALARLVASELVFQRGAPPDAVYSFKHALVQDAAHGSLLRGTRQQLHAQIAQALEAHSPEMMDSQPELFAQHYAEAGLVEKSVSYWLKAGRSSSARSANLEAIAYLRRGIEATAGFGNAADRDRMELDLQCALGPCVIATQGPISDQARATFARAHELCERLDNPPQHLTVLYWLAVAHGVRGDLSKAAEATQAGIVLAEARGDRPALVNFLRGAGLGLTLMGRLTAGRDLTERSVAAFDASDEAERRSAGASGQDAKAASLAVMSWALWALGYADTAIARMTAALERADAIAHPHTQAYVSYYASILYALRGAAMLANRQAERCFTLSQERGFGHWSRPSRIVLETCASLLDPSSCAIEDAQGELNDLRRTGYQMGITALHVVVCEALALQHLSEPMIEVVAQGLATVGRTDERFLHAELYRLKALALLARGTAEADTEAQNLLGEALSTARQQGARALELRAATSLARLHRDQGRRTEARDLLVPVYGWFTEGFDTHDLRDAKMLLDELQ
jgi:predicted ATPase/class 3 adenylate cyclase